MLLKYSYKIALCQGVFTAIVSSFLSSLFSMVSTINTILAYLTIGGDIALLVGIIGGLFFKDQLTSLPIYKYVEKNATFFAFLTALFATIMSLYYSDIVGYAPCKLCWLQRIFIYPQVILFFIAWRIKDANIWRYSLPISMFGALIGLYHLYLQFGGNPLIPCAAPGPGAVSCTQQFVMEFGFVSIPVMSLTCFGIMIALMIVQKRSAK
jgi:disulfide bond formation protein DsbB